MTIFPVHTLAQQQHEQRDLAPDQPGEEEDLNQLTLFGRDVTPNHHKLAQEFVTLDNFYANGEISVLGHSFTTSGYASPFLEWLGNIKYSSQYLPTGCSK